MTGAYIVAISFLVSRTRRREDGQGLAEYALAAAVVAALFATALALLGQSLDAFYRAMEALLNA